MPIISTAHAVNSAGPIITEPRGERGFTKVDIADAIQATIVAGDKTSVKIEAAANILPLIHSKVEGDTLKVYVDGSFRSNQPIIVRITAPHLTAAQGSGASRISLKGFKESDFEGNVSGASTLTFDGMAKSLKSESSGASTASFNFISGGEVQLEASGASRITVLGTCERVTADASGGSHLDLALLKAENAEATASGASTIKVAANRGLRVDASGASQIIYTGNANVSQEISGASSVTKG